MASSSTSYVQKSFRYDVFLSFRGEDTRKNFVDHLYFALERKGIHTYKDDERIKKGKKISDELIKSIEDSRFYVIVFSKTYASSSWCLDELVKIMECQKTTEHTAYPVFYDVEPTEVHKQSGEFGQAFAKHERAEAAEKWREALEEAAALAGWELKNTVNGHEAKFIHKIVEEISLELRSISFSNDGKLVGMESRIKDVLSSLEMGFDDVRMIGIKGIGGGGKTTLARAIYDQISHCFEGKSFVENVREVSEGSLSGLKSLQKQVLSDVLNDQCVNVSSVHEGKNMMKKMMCGRKVLVVLDDVDHTNQLDALAGDPKWFRSGSRIIITTRDEQVLIAHRVNMIHDVNLLSYDEAICLFNRYAFGREIPIQVYENLSRQVVHYAAGLPLTITVLGSFLCGKNELEWRDALERLKTIPLKETLEKLELSYAGLEEDYKEIFLDVACILKGWRKEEAIRVLESCGFHGRIGLRVLERKSLITISISNDENEYLSMHDHLEEMGRNIVRRLHPDEPNKHSRIWNDEEIKDILANDLGTEETRYICTFTSELDPKIIMNGLGKMKKLIFLHKYSNSYNRDFRGWKLDEVRQCLPNALRYMSWRNYPFWSLPKTFEGNNLVTLEMCHSKIVQLWKRGKGKVLNNLRFLDLSYSMLKTLNLGMAPNLETLTLKECHDLVKVHIPISCLNLMSFNLDWCERLRILDLGLTPNLETLSVKRCYNLAELHMPIKCLRLRYLNLLHLKDSKTSLNLGQTLNLETLCVDRNSLVKLHMPNEFLKLRSLKLSFSTLRTFDLGWTPNLEILHLEHCDNLVELHMPLECLKLRSLQIWNSKLRTLDIGRMPNLKILHLEQCVDFVELKMLVECLKLQSLDLHDLKLKTLDLRLVTNLVMLNIERCDYLVELHMPVVSLELKNLKVSGSKLRTFDLGRTPNLEDLCLEECDDLVEFHMHGECLKLICLILKLSKLKTLNLGGTPNLVKLFLERCSDLVELHGCVRGLVNLDYLALSGCLGFKSVTFRKLMTSMQLVVEFLDNRPSSSNDNLLTFESTCSFEEHADALLVGNLENISIGQCVYRDLKGFVKSICGLQFLKELTLREAPKNLDLVECLDEISFSSTECLEELNLLHLEIKHLPDSIYMLINLRSIDLTNCMLLEKLPEDLDRLECLEKLVLTNCISLRDIPNCISKMKRLRYLFLDDCTKVEKLPEELGRSESLKELSIKGTRISHLPQTIFLLKGLRIIGSRKLLELCGFTSVIQTSKCYTFCYV